MCNTILKDSFQCEVCEILVKIGLTQHHIIGISNISRIF